MQAENRAGIFFFHNPKAAGTAIDQVLGSRFSAAQRCPLIENTQRDHERLGGDYARFRGYQYYGGHYGADILRNLDNTGLSVVTNFREPAARLLSLYNYYRLDVALPQDANARDELYPVLFAQSCNFHEFVSTPDPRVEIHTRNHHVRQLTSSAWDPCSQGDLSQAGALLDSMAWFYVCEQPALSHRWGRAVFGTSFSKIPQQNVTSRDNGSDRAVGSMDANTRRTIEAKNALDGALYQRAVKLLRQANRWSWLCRLSARAP